MRSLPPLVLFLVSAVLVPPLVGCNHQAELDALRAYESDAASASAMCQGSADPTTDPNACGVTCDAGSTCTLQCPGETMAQAVMGEARCN